MNGDIRDPQPDDDIPTLTEIVVPGRLRPEPELADGAGSAPPEFVFDIAFAPTDGRGEQPCDSRNPPLAVEAVPEGMFELPVEGPAAGQEADLPLPWAGESPPAQAQTETATSGLLPDEPEPLVDVPEEAPVANVEPPDADAQALLRALLAEIGNGLEQRLQAELALTEQRLRAALREELDTRLRELLAGAPPTS